ncbi:hypothetical protein [Pseudomonas batumici]|uniref:SGNH hydrolase-type esterase domain-containing protein n=1 Tax=Pseudomonas batumici TaxID=226910 RepID=A0A0C2I0S0_9PSED|nr:hypothetical protein [Pseudomonas batumici]KIH80555.1 hypothetical protein UCMB321_5684 [Pseudomonas batumici]
MRAIMGALVMAWATTSLADIKWEVANGFPQFRNEADFQRLKAAWPAGATAEQFMAGQDAQRLRDLLPVNSTIWNNLTGQYDKARLFNGQHEILLWLTTDSASRCTWYVNEVPVARDVPCKRVVRSRPLPENVEFSIRVEHDGPAEKPLTSERINGHTILALGDSFAAGEGNPDHAAKLGNQAGYTSVVSRDWFLMKHYGNYRYSTSAQWWDETCHRSFLSWQSLYALELAMSDPHRVVRFASFACSGAELYDGFFRAQLNPPGFGNVTRVRNTPARDGGNILSPFPAPRLNRSQLNAALDLLCPSAPKGEERKQMRPEEAGLRKSPYYGEFTYQRCADDLQPVDEVLLAFGGNDFGFSSVVKWALVPSTATRGVFNSVREFALEMLRESSRIEVIDPAVAGRMATKQALPMYQDLDWSLQHVLHVPPTRVTMLVYPDPLPDTITENCTNRLSVGNVALTQMFMVETEQIPFLRRHAKNFIFQIDKTDGLLVKEQFIGPLQKAQRKAINKMGWLTLESQAGFASKDGLRSMCSVAPACVQQGGCPIPDRFAWTYDDFFLSAKGLQQVKEAEDAKRLFALDPTIVGWKDTSGMPLAHVQEWEPYTDSRLRGLRTSNDAVMTQAVFNARGLITTDWMSGAVHPVAQVHAGIADQLRQIKLQQVSDR